MSSFGHYIKVEREKRNWTQTDFGAKIGINATAISRIENGSQKFSKTKLSELGKLFEIDIQEIKNLFYADKFASEAYKNDCSDNIFVLAEEAIRYIGSKNIEQIELNFESHE